MPLIPVLQAVNSSSQKHPLLLVSCASFCKYFKGIKQVCMYPFYFFTEVVAYCVHRSAHSFFHLVVNPGDHSNEYLQLYVVLFHHMAVTQFH